MNLPARSIIALCAVTACASLAFSQRVITTAPVPAPPVVPEASEDTTPIPAGFPRYNVVPIGAGIEARGLSDTGYVTGAMVTDTGKKHAFLWKDGTLTDLGTLYSDDSYGSGVNDAGEVVGVSTAINKTMDDGTVQEARHPFLYKNGKMTDISGKELNTEGGDTWQPFDINNRGMAVGKMTQNGVGMPAVSWLRGRLTSLGTLGGYMATAYACSDRGGIVGASYVAGNNAPRTGEESAFLYRSGRMTELGTLGGKSSTALDVNNLGDVVGFSQLYPLTAQTNRAFLVKRGKMSDLGTFGGDSSTANGINDAGQIVGCAQTTKQNVVYFLYQNGVKVDLQRLVSRASGWNLSASDSSGTGPLGSILINNRGQIVCQARKADKGRGAVLLVPVSSDTGAAAAP
ncbi:MAG: DUF3466 family protein [Akkermansiaceae bacterium]|nr:DUF3466 family protein [Armatimonadota bacterium]